MNEQQRKDILYHLDQIKASADKCRQATADNNGVTRLWEEQQEIEWHTKQLSELTENLEPAP